MINCNTPEEMIAVIKAFQEGKQIQWNLVGAKEDSPWRTAPPIWNFSVCHYRAKPEIKKSCGYRRYLCVLSITNPDGPASVLTAKETFYNPIVEAERHPGFVKWIDTEWQYETYETNGDK